MADIHNETSDKANTTCELCDVSHENHDELWCLAHQYKKATNKLLERTLQLNAEKNKLKTENILLKKEMHHIFSLKVDLFEELATRVKNLESAVGIKVPSANAKKRKAKTAPGNP
jgi:hypothetical protein